MGKEVNRHFQKELEKFRAQFPSLPLPKESYLQKTEEHYREYGKRYLEMFLDSSELDFINEMEFSIKAILSELEAAVDPFKPNSEEIYKWIFLINEGEPDEALRANRKLRKYHINIHDSQTIRIWRTYLSFLQSRKEAINLEIAKPVIRFTYREAAFILSYAKIRVTNDGEARAALEWLPMEGNKEAKTAEAQLKDKARQFYGKSSRLAALDQVNNGRTVRELKKTIKKVREFLKDEKAIQSADADLKKIRAYLKGLKPFKPL